jgi:tripartite-type tricarboxylate transporter receptor subunit TctC
MKHSRRRFLHIAASTVVMPAGSRVAAAQTYPSRPITMIVPAAAGGTTDVVGRMFAERMRGSLGQPVIVENIGGADGSLGAGRAARAIPDGYTIELGFLSNHVLTGILYSLPYDPLTSFAPVAPLVKTPLVLLGRKTLPATDLKQLVVWLKANQDTASAGVVTVGIRLLSLLFRNETGTQFTLVPYRGLAPARQDLVAGQIDLMFDTSDAMALARAGSVKVYAVVGDTRLALAPDIPTFAEMNLPAVSYSTWYGLFAPKGTPKDVVDRLHNAAVEAMADPAVRKRIIGLGLEAFPRDQQTPEVLGKLVTDGAAKWWPIMKAAGIKAE